MNGIERATSWRSPFFSTMTNKEHFKNDIIFFTDNVYLLKN